MRSSFLSRAEQYLPPSTPCPAAGATTSSTTARLHVCIHSHRAVGRLRIRAGTSELILPAERQRQPGFPAATPVSSPQDRVVEPDPSCCSHLDFTSTPARHSLSPTWPSAPLSTAHPYTLRRPFPSQHTHWDQAFFIPADLLPQRESGCVRVPASSVRSLPELPQLPYSPPPSLLPHRYLNLESHSASELIAARRSLAATPPCRLPP